MRFKPRTDLERIFDAINDYSYGKINKKIVNRQLKNLELEEPAQLPSNSDIEDHHASFNNRTHSVTEVSNSKVLKKGGRKFVDNSEAKLLLKDYHNKTHFKAATDIALFNRMI